ncbi:MAG: cellulose binding domain-containing protein [Terracidiphilus sp.]
MAVLAALVLTFGALRADAQCKVTYTISPQNSSQFGATVSIQNTGTTTLSNWSLTWSFANGQTIANSWNGTVSQSGANVTVSEQSGQTWQNIPAGGTYSGFGFNGTWNGTTNAVPTNLAVNGTACNASLGSFTLKPSSTTLSVAQGASGTDTITVTDVSPFAGAVAFSASGMPTGVTASFNPTSSTTSSVVTFAVASTTVAGTYPITITGTSGTLTATTSISLTVTAKPSFTLSLASPLSVTQGSSTTDTLTITDVGGFTGTVALALSGTLPSGVTCSLSPASATTTAVLTCTATSTATVGQFNLTITGTSGTTTATTIITGNVVSSTGSFSLASSPTGCTMPQGGSCSITISITDVSPFNGSVTLTATGLPTGVSAAASVNPAATTSVITFSASTAAPVGASTVTITGTSGSLTKTITITLTITTGGNFLVTPSAPSLAVFEGASVTDTLTVTDVSPFNGSVTCAVSGQPAGVTPVFSVNPFTTTSVLTLSTSSATPTGSYPLTITCTSGTLTEITGIGFTVTAGGGSFTLTPSSSALTLHQSSAASDTITVNDVGGFTGAVTLTASGMPSGVTAAFSTNPATGSSMLTLTATSAATVGSSTITIQGTSTGTSAGTLSATTTIALTVSSTPLVQIAWVSPAAGTAGSTFTVMPGVGASFAETQGSSVINFGTTAATVTTWAIDSVAVTVPNLAVGTYNVTAIIGGVTSNAVPFTITSATPSPEVYTGNSTWFSALGSPYGGCGVPQANIDSQNFVALNVQNDPGNYTLTLSRPISTTGPNAADIGLWNNGLNCGRWVHITMGANCEGTNDGNQDLSFCRGGLGWVPDQFTGSELDLVVADSCQDENSWCRDDPYHLDQAQGALANYTLGGVAVGNMYPNFWNNRQISWYFEPAPSYTGDINIGFLTGANAYWSAISITHLPNGIHGVQYLQNGVWTAAVMDADLGDDYIVLPTVAGGTQYEIQVFDVTNTLINSGRIYSFSYPTSCGSSCTPALTPVTFTTSQ